MCICQQEYVGLHCKHRKRQTQIDISFHSRMTIPSAILLHFTAIHEKAQPNTTSMMKKVRFDQSILTVYISHLFNIAFAQIFNDYYLIIVQEKTINAANITTKIIPSHRCRSISELFNETFVKQHLLKRIKYYHIPCLQQLQLICFYDEIHFCLCTIDRQSNCFEFNHSMTYDCGGDNI
jgi:hypothetical protein